jgi:hypothetical protein
MRFKKKNLRKSAGKICGICGKKHIKTLTTQ